MKRFICGAQGSGVEAASGGEDAARIYSSHATGPTEIIRNVST